MRTELENEAYKIFKVLEKHGREGSPRLEGIIQLGNFWMETFDKIQNEFDKWAEEEEKKILIRGR